MAEQNLENLLHAWMNMELSIRGNRILSDFSFNEMAICQILLRCENEGNAVTATELCNQMHLLKSQMNRLLSGMEEKGMITRVRSDSDRRKVYVQLDRRGASLYVFEHEQILDILDTLLQEMGQQKFSELTTLMQTATKIVERKINEEHED